MSQYFTHRAGGCGCNKGCGQALKRWGSSGMGGGPRRCMGDSGDGLSGALDSMGKGYVLVGLACLAVFIFSERGARR